MASISALSCYLSTTKGDEIMTRQKLTVKEVLEPKPIGDKGAILQEFIATDGLKYGTFSKTLAPHIKVGAELDVEVEESKRDYQGNTYIDRRIKDIFENGQSVKGQQKQWGYRGKSPEELELSARSYALAYAKDLAVAGKIEICNIIPMANEYYEWFHSNEWFKTIPTATVMEKAIKEEKPSPLKGEGEESLFGFKPATQPQMKKIMELNQKHPGKAKELIKEWGWEATDVTKLTRDQARHLIEELEKLPENKELPFD